MEVLTLVCGFQTVFDLKVRFSQGPISICLGFLCLLPLLIFKLWQSMRRSWLYRAKRAAVQWKILGMCTALTDRKEFSVIQETNKRPMWFVINWWEGNWHVTLEDGEINRGLLICTTSSKLEHYKQYYLDVYSMATEFYYYHSICLFSP